MTSRHAVLVEAIGGFLDRHGMAPSRFGRETLGEPGLVAHLLGGRIPRLDTADRLLAWMGEKPFGPAFRSEVEAFIAATGTKISALGLHAVGDSSFVSRLRKGSSPRLDTCDRVSAWMAGQPGGGRLPAPADAAADADAVDETARRCQVTGPVAAASAPGPGPADRPARHPGRRTAAR